MALSTASAAASAPDAVMAVANPLHLPADPIACERIGLGRTGDYKACVARLPDGELLLSAFRITPQSAHRGTEQILLFRSRDGGRSWSEPEQPALPGREPYLTVLPDGTIFITCHLLPYDLRNRWGHTCGFLHRSTDRGRTWSTTRVEAGFNDFKLNNTVSRNVARLADGSLLLGVDYSGPTGGPTFIWRSHDEGASWEKNQPCEPKNFLNMRYGFFGGETWLWTARSGKIWALNRVDSGLMPISGRATQSTSDNDDHFVLYSSADQGRTFLRGADFGEYGEMYMSMLRLQDHRLLLTFTVRSRQPPLGLRAIPGVETEDGFQFDFAHDRVMLDTRTPLRFRNYEGAANPGSGGGFGPTVQLDDGALVSSYSYRGEDAQTHLEVVRWRLPVSKPGPF